MASLRISPTTSLPAFETFPSGTRVRACVPPHAMSSKRTRSKDCRARFMLLLRVGSGRRSSWETADAGAVCDVEFRGKDGSTELEFSLYLLSDCAQVVRSEEHT